MQKQGIKITFLDKTYEIEVEENLIPFVKQIEELVVKRWNEVKNTGLKGEDLKNKVVFTLIWELMEENKKLKEDNDYCLEFLQKINLSLEEKIISE